MTNTFHLRSTTGRAESAARRFPRIHMLHSDDSDDLAGGGRNNCFQHEGEDETPLEPLSADDAGKLDPSSVPVQEISGFGAESATDEDVEALISIRNVDAPDAGSLDILGRLEQLGWVSQDPSGVVALTPLGAELLRHRLA